MRCDASRSMRPSRSVAAPILREARTHGRVCGACLPGALLRMRARTSPRARCDERRLILGLAFAKPLFASRKIFRGHTNLDNPGLIDTGYAHVFKDTVINFALARFLDDNVLAAVDQRPKCGCLGLLGRVRTESEIDPGIGQVSVTRRIGDPEFPNGGFRGDLWQGSSRLRHGRPSRNPTAIRARRARERFTGRTCGRCTKTPVSVFPIPAPTPRSGSKVLSRSRLVRAGICSRPTR